MPTPDSRVILRSAAKLVDGPEPDPLQWLVEGLFVTGSIGFLVGLWKSYKSWLLLEMLRAIVSGDRAFGALEVTQGPAIYAGAESGERQLHRRLDMLKRGRALASDDFTDLYYIAGNHVRLDDSGCRRELMAAAKDVGAIAVVLDPWVRFKSGGRDENDQSSMAPMLDALLEIRDETGASPISAAHTGKLSETIRGSSDMESIWESRVAVKRDGSSIELTAGHRDEADHETKVRVDFDPDTRTVRLEATDTPVEREQNVHDDVIAFLTEHPGASGVDVEKGVTGRGALIRKVLAQLEEAGTTSRGPSQKLDDQGRVRTYKGHFLTAHAGSLLVPDPGTTRDERSAADAARPVPLSLRGTSNGGTTIETDDQALTELFSRGGATS